MEMAKLVECSRNALDEGNAPSKYPIRFTDKAHYKPSKKHWKVGGKILHTKKGSTEVLVKLNFYAL